MMAMAMGLGCGATEANREMIVTDVRKQQKEQERQKLRNEFAKAALTGLCTTDLYIDTQRIAVLAYRVADAMLAVKDRNDEN